MNDDDIAIRHNYDAIDKQISELTNREALMTENVRIINRKAKINNLIRDSLRKILLLLSLGLFAILFAYAIRLVIYL